MQLTLPPSYLLLSPLSAVRLNETAGRESVGNFVILPAGMTLAINGNSTIRGLIDVTCEGAKYAIFRIDLDERSELVNASEAGC